MSRFFKAANADKQFQLLASFVCECALPDYSMLKYPGSLMAASAVYVAMKTLGKGEWNNVMEAHTRYTEVWLGCVTRLCCVSILLIWR